MHKPFVIVDVLIVIGISICVGIAVYAFYLDRPPTYDMQEFLVLSNETATNRLWNITIEFKTYDVFGARTRLDVSSVASTMSEPKYSNAWIYFPTSINDPPKFENSKRVPANIELNYIGRNSDGAYVFEGSTILSYPTGGQKVIEFWEQYQRTVFMDGKGEQDIIFISSEDSKYQYEINKAAMALGWVVAGLTIIVCRGFVKEFVEDFKHG